MNLVDIKAFKLTFRYCYNYQLIVVKDTLKESLLFYQYSESKQTHSKNPLLIPLQFFNFVFEFRSRFNK